MTMRVLALLSVTILLCAGCGRQTPAPPRDHGVSSASPVSCRQQYQTWNQGPARVTARRAAAVLKAIQAAGPAGNRQGMQAAMKKLVPAALILARHPVPGCADPGRLYSRLVIRIYQAGTSARTARSLSDLREAAAPLKGLARTERQLTAEVRRALERRSDSQAASR